MTLILSGTDGLSDIDGSAATPAIRGTDANTGIFFGTDIIGFSEGGVEAARINADSQFVAAAGTAALPVITTTGDLNTGIFFPAADTIAFSEGGAEIARFDSSGNLGIGTTSVTGSTKLEVAGNVAAHIGIRANNASASGFSTLWLSNAGGNDGIIRGGASASAYTNQLAMLTGGATPITFNTNSVERMRIDSSGNVLIGTTSINTISPRLTILGMTAGNQWSCGPTSGNDSFFIYNQSSVGVYLGYGNTSWSSSSDERIKTAIIPFENALEKVCTLRAGTGRYLTDEETVSRSFLIAQDVQAVLPEAVNVQDDEIGTLGLQYTDVIPLLVAAMQEQQSLITALTARITALETAP